MNKLLLISGIPKKTENLLYLAKKCGFFECKSVSSGADGRRCLCDEEYNLVIVQSPLPDEFGHELSLKAAEDTSSGVIFICNVNIAEELSDKFSSYGVQVISESVDDSKLCRVIKTVSAERSRLRDFQNNRKVQDKIEEIILINKAKQKLIKDSGFSEPQAHRYIVKQAMDRRQTRKDVAKDILENYK